MVVIAEMGCFWDMRVSLGIWEMGLGPDAFNVGAWDVEKSKGRKKKDEENEMTGCWFKFRFIGSCMSSKSKVDGSMSGTSTQYGILLFCF